MDLLTAAKVLIGFLGALLAIAGAELIIRPPGESFTKAVGGSVVMTCTLKLNKTYTAAIASMDNVVVTWIDRNGLEVHAKSGHMYVEAESLLTKKLYITGIRTSDAGLYTCRADGTMLTEEKSVQLQLFKDIAFEDTPTAQSVAMHSDAIIFCRATGNPVPDMSWRYNGHRILQDERYMLTYEGLKVIGISQADEGEYTCRAEVEIDGRYDERRINVSVHVPPRLLTELIDTEGVQSNTFSLSCRADGLPAPTYQFYKDGVMLVSSTRIEQNALTGSLYFNPLHKEDQGIYNCTAYNDVGIVSSSASLTVLVPPSIVGITNAIVQEGQSAVLSCQSKGDPVPDMTFYRQQPQQQQILGSYMLNSNTSDIGAKIVQPNSTHILLEFEFIMPSQAGNYICRSRNKVGVDEQIASLVVQFKPRFSANHSRQSYAWAPRTRNVTCQVYAHPAPSFEWLRNGRRIEPNDTFRIFQSDGVYESTSFLQIRVRESDQSWIYGTYTCIATNFLGIDDIGIELKRASAPDAPKAVSVVERLPTELVLTASLPDDDGGLPITGYRVEFEDQVKNFGLMQTLAVLWSNIKFVAYCAQFVNARQQAPMIAGCTNDNDKKLLRITGLKPSTKYMLRVRAVSEVGPGNPALQTVITENIRRPYPVVITSSPHGREAYEYTVTWQAPSSGGLTITEYEFYYRRVAVEEGTLNFTEPLEDWISFVEFERPDHPLLYQTLHDLEPNTYYQLEIRAKNSLGKSDPNSFFIFHTGLGESAEVQHSHQARLSLTVLIAVCAGVLFVFIAIVDLSCYFMYNNGVTMFLCVHCCGQQQHHRRRREPGLEEGESEKRPLSDDAPVDSEVITAFQSRSVVVSTIPTEDEDEQDAALNVASPSLTTHSQRHVPSIVTVCTLSIAFTLAV